MPSEFHSRTCTLLILACATVIGCDSDDAHDVNDEFLLARTVSPEGVEIEFRRGQDGGIVVSEYGPETAPSPVVYLAATENATPLEVFLAVAPDQEPPRELVQQHELAMRELDQPVTPRSLRLPDPSFRTTYLDYYATNCSYTSDKSWFDDSWDALGMEWHAYATVYLDPIDNEYFTYTSPTTNSFITHFCAHSVDWETSGSGDPYLRHYLYTGSGLYLPLTTQAVYEGYRSLIWIWNESDQYKGMIKNAMNSVEATVRAGVMANVP
jgi:hypothetical protein